MTMTITAASAATHITADAMPSPKSAAPEKAAGAASADASKAQQQAALNQLLVKYTRDQAQGADARILSALGKQIMAAAKVLGQHVTLPHVPPASAAGSASQAESGASKTKMVNVTA